MKILAIQFRYFGDAVLMVPALRALREAYPDSDLHLLVAAEVMPLFRHLPWLTRLWGLPRTRGRARFVTAWPILRALRRERFDRSVDFAGNDRGAILSLMCGARERLAPRTQGGFLGRRFCYTRTVPTAPLDRHETERNLHVLTPWNVPRPRTMELEIHPDPALEGFARKLLPERGAICHIATTQPKKEWPLRHWAELFQMASTAGLKLFFSTGTGGREQALLTEFQTLAPSAPVLPPLPDLASFLAILKRAEAFVSCDTGPLHFAAGLGVPTVSLFGATPAQQWAPQGAHHQIVQGSPCSCDGNTAVCVSVHHCMAPISPAEVFRRIQLVRNGS